MGDENEKKYKALSKAWKIPTKPDRLMNNSKLWKILKLLRLIK